MHTIGRPLSFTPFVDIMPLDLVPIAGMPLLEHFLRNFEAAGFEKIELVLNQNETEVKLFLDKRDSDASIDTINQLEDLDTNENTFHFYGNHFFGTRAIIQFIKYVEAHPDEISIVPFPEKLLSETFTDLQISPVSFAYFPSGDKHSLPQNPEEVDFNFFCPSESPELPIRGLWDIINLNSVLMEETVPSMKGTIQQGATIIDPVIIEEGTIIRAGSYIEGPVIIGKDCVIGPNCFLRPGTCLGSNVRIGNGVELKNTIIMDSTNIGHLAYVGDSIIGPNCNFGAGTKIGNLRFDNAAFKMKIGSLLIDTGVRKLGVFVGENVKTGINSSLMGGITIGSSAMIGPGAIIYRNVAANTRISVRQQTEIAKT